MTHATGVAKKRVRPGHVTAAGGNVFRDIGFSPEEAENLRIRTDLMLAVERRITGLSQIRAAELLGVSQPRVSDLKRRKVNHFSIDALVNMLARAGVHVRVTAR